MHKPLTLIVTALLLTACLPTNAPTQPQVAASPSPAPTSSAEPTDEEVKEAIRRILTPIYLNTSSLVNADRVDFEFRSIQRGTPVSKSMDGAAPGSPVIPVKVDVQLTVHYSYREPTTHERGKEANDVFFFYRDAFGQWNFKTGSL